MANIAKNRACALCFLLPFLINRAGGALIDYNQGFKRYRTSEKTKENIFLSALARGGVNGGGGELPPRLTRRSFTHCLVFYGYTLIAIKKDAVLSDKF